MVWPLLSDPGSREVEAQQGKSHRSRLTLLSLRTQPRLATNTSGHGRKVKPEEWGWVEVQLFPPLEKLLGAHGFQGQLLPHGTG